MGEVRTFLKSMLPSSVLFVTLFSLTTAYARVAVCIEGGTVLGFPWEFFVQCYGPVIPGGGQAVDAPTFYLAGLILDLVLWYFVSLGLWRLGLALFRRFRGGGRPQNQGS